MPANHLDLRSREVLEDALDEYEGTLVVVSHDRYFINRIATTIAAVGDGRVEQIPGDYDAWIEWRRSRLAAQEDRAEPSREARAREAERERRRAEAEERNRRHRERRAVEERLRPLEERIERLDRRVGEIDREQADPGTYRDGERARSLAHERAELERRLAAAGREWGAVAAEMAD